MIFNDLASRSAHFGAQKLCWCTDKTAVPLFVQNTNQDWLRITPSGPTLASKGPIVVHRNLVGNFSYRFLIDCPCTPFVFLRVGSALKSQ